MAWPVRRWGFGPVALLRAAGEKAHRRAIFTYRRAALVSSLYRSRCQTLSGNEAKRSGNPGLVNQSSVHEIRPGVSIPDRRAPGIRPASETILRDLAESPSDRCAVRKFSLLHNVLAIAASDQFGANAIVRVEPGHPPRMDRRVINSNSRAIPVGKLGRLRAAVRSPWIDKHILHRAAFQHPGEMRFTRALGDVAVVVVRGEVQFPTATQPAVEIVRRRISGDRSKAGRISKNEQDAFVSSCAFIGSSSRPFRTRPATWLPPWKCSGARLRAARGGRTCSRTAAGPQDTPSMRNRVLLVTALPSVHGDGVEQSRRVDHELLAEVR